jgi:hypothetical protein
MPCPSLSIQEQKSRQMDTLDRPFRRDTTYNSFQRITAHQHVLRMPCVFPLFPFHLIHFVKGVTMPKVQGKDKKEPENMMEDVESLFGCCPSFKYPSMMNEIGKRSEQRSERNESGKEVENSYRANSN